MSRLLKSKRVAFTQAPNEIVQNKGLSFKARGLWVYLESKPDDWKFSIKRISQDSTDGIDSVRTGILELENVGLLERKLAYNEDGHFDGYDYVIHIEPLLDFPSTEKPSTEKPSTENPTTYKERGNNKDLEIKKYKFFILKRGSKIFQENIEERFDYSSSNYVIIQDNVDVFDGSIIVPEIYFVDYLSEIHPMNFDGLLMSFTGNGRAERLSNFLKIKSEFFKEKARCKFSDFDHLSNTIKKIKRESERKFNYQQVQKVPVFSSGQDNIF